MLINTRHSIVHLMGHQSYAGDVVQLPTVDDPLLGLRVPEVEFTMQDDEHLITMRQPEHLLYFGVQAIYMIQPCSKQDAIQEASRCPNVSVSEEVSRRPLTDDEMIVASPF